MAPYQHIKLAPIEDESFEVGLAYPHNGGLQCIKHGKITETIIDSGGDTWCSECFNERRYIAPPVSEEQE